jgi:hypothetical protein
MKYDDLHPEMLVKVVDFGAPDYSRPEHWSTDGDMDDWQGAVVTIAENDGDYIYIHEDEGEWSWLPLDFEPHCSLKINNPNVAYKRKKSSDFLTTLSIEWEAKQAKKKG